MNLKLPFLFSILLSATLSAAEHPGVVLIMADDQCLGGRGVPRAPGAEDPEPRQFRRERRAPRLLLHRPLQLPADTGQRPDRVATMTEDLETWKASVMKSFT